MPGHVNKKPTGHVKKKPARKNEPANPYTVMKKPVGVMKRPAGKKELARKEPAEDPKQHVPGADPDRPHHVPFEGFRFSGFQVFRLSGLQVFQVSGLHAGFQVFRMACRFSGCQVLGGSGLHVVGVQAFAFEIFMTGVLRQQLGDGLERALPVF